MHISTSEIIRISHFVMLNVNVSKEERKKPPFLLSQPCCQDMHVASHSCKSGKGVTSVFKPLFWPANFRLLLVALFCMSELTLLLLFLIYIHAHVKACVYVLALRQLRWQWLPGELKLMTVIRSKLRAMQGQLIQAMWAELVVRSARQAWLELKRWRIKMQPQTNPTVFFYTQQMSTEGKAVGAWHGHASTIPATWSAQPNASWQPPGSSQITPSSLFSLRAKGRNSQGPLRCIRKGLIAKLHSGATMCERER